MDLYNIINNRFLDLFHQKTTSREQSGLFSPTKQLATPADGPCHTAAWLPIALHN
jgi:hypothetical protein